MKMMNVFWLSSSGALTKGCAREDSDIDFMMVATDEEHQRRKQLQDQFINRRDLCDYP